MIKSHDRSGWFGASDTSKIMGNWETQTFAKFWLEKLGVLKNNFTNSAMQAGTNYEHKILSAIGITKVDRQIKKRSLRLRVNLDGEDETTIYEVKTHQKDFKVTKAYYQQAQVQMYATGKRLVIVAYRLTDDDYINYFNEIDEARISFHPIERDEEFISESLKTLGYLSKCLRKRRTPSREDFESQNHRR